MNLKKIEKTNHKTLLLNTRSNFDNAGRFRFRKRLFNRGTGPVPVPRNFIYSGPGPVPGLTKI